MFLVATPTETVNPSSGGSVQITLTGPAPNPTMSAKITFSSGSFNTAGAIAQALATGINTNANAEMVSLATPGAGAIVLANPRVAMVGVRYKPVGTTATGSYVIRAINSPFQFLNLQSLCLGTSCQWRGGLTEPGDGINVRGTAHNVSIRAAQIISPNFGAGVHFARGSSFLAQSNNLGALFPWTSSIGFQIDAPVSNYFVANNDVFSAGTPAVVVSPSPFPAASPFIIRENRGYNPTIGLGAPGFPASGYSYSNLGPLDCTFYVSWPHGGTATASGSNGFGSTLTAPTQIYLPVGTTITVSYSGTPTPSWVSFCD
jgi:hypothetical protein